VISIRAATPDDYDRIAPVIDEWWGGREMAAMLPRLFFMHFAGTTFVAEDGDELTGFLTGFLSQTHPDEAYVHFVGVSPAYRSSGVGRRLYERLFHAVTAPVNTGSLAFHRALGFEVERVADGYDGRGGDRVLLVKRLAPRD
jgi:ribosomal protein S18 acetylase RimI-like enzyme